MTIKHMAILSTDEMVQIRDKVFQCTHRIRVYLTFQPDRDWVWNFINEWRHLPVYSRRKVNITGNEIHITIFKNDILQKYIELITETVEKTNQRTWNKKLCSSVNQ